MIVLSRGETKGGLTRAAVRVSFLEKNNNYNL